jgi:hypothetical protein
MKDLKKLLDEQKHICQTEFDKRSKLIDGVWYVACEDVLKAPYPKQLRLYGVSGMLPLNENAKEKLEYINGHWIVREFPKIEKVDLQWVGAVLDLLEELKLGNYR